MWSSREEVPSPQGFARRLPAGQRAWVTLVDGRQHEGQVRRVDDGTLELALPDSDVSLALSDVRRIEIPDSIGNGAAWGAISGGAAMGTVSTVLAVAFCERGDDCTGSAAAFVLATAAVGAGLGALGGALIDSVIDGRRVVYSADGPSVTLAPLRVSGGGGLSGRISWGARR